MDDDAFISDRTNRFDELRQSQLNKTAIIRTKLEMRFMRLATGVQAIAGGHDYWTWQDMQRVKAFEKQIVVWEDEKVFERCRFCGQRFTLFMRKHHCRICGLVVCGDLERECSLEVPISLLAERLSSDYPELKSVTTQFGIRVCSECRFMLLSKRGFQKDICRDQMPQLLRIHEQLAKFEQEINRVLPHMMELIGDLPAMALTGRQTQQQLLALCAKYDQTVRRLRAIHFEAESDQKLQLQILEKTRLFWDSVIRPLKGMSQALSQALSPRVEQKPQNADKWQQKLVVLNEQRFLLEQQISQAKQSRHFDALAPMEQSLVEIDKEMYNLSKMLGSFGPQV